MNEDQSASCHCTMDLKNQIWIHFGDHTLPRKIEDVLFLIPVEDIILLTHLGDPFNCGTIVFSYENRRGFKHCEMWKYDTFKENLEADQIGVVDDR